MTCKYDCPGGEHKSCSGGWGIKKSHSRVVLNNVLGGLRGAVYCYPGGVMSTRDVISRCV